MKNFYTNWIFKNSWHADTIYDTIQASILDFGEKRGIALPVWDDSLSLERKCLDKDNDGYYNWGLDMDTIPLGCQLLCSELEDWNDNNEHIGPKDDNFNGIEIHP